jgi:hypothetical protein
VEVVALPESLLTTSLSLVVRLVAVWEEEVRVDTVIFQANLYR